MKIKIVEREEELKECLKIRKKSFVEKEKIFKESDVDEYDYQKSTIHLIAYDKKGKPIGTVRICMVKNGTFRGSRLAVLENSDPFLPMKLIKKAVEIVRKRRGKEFIAYVRPQLLNLFKRCGWIWKGERINYAGREHLIMYAMLNERSSGNKKKP